MSFPSPGPWDPAQLAARLVPSGDAPLVTGGDVRRAAVAVLLRLGATPEVLLMRRAEHEGDPWSGHVSFPGGRHEPIDPDLLATAIRETREELGIDLARSARLLGELPHIDATARGRILPMTISAYVFVEETAVAPVLNHEAEAAFWLPLAEASAGVLDDVYHYPHTDPPLQLPCWRFQGQTVWGLTYKLLRSMLDTVTSPFPAE